MKKKWGIVLIFALLLLTLAGCSNVKKSDVHVEEQVLHQITEKVIESFSVMDEDMFLEFKKGSDLAVNLSLLQTGIPADKEVFVKMADAWQGATKECGDYIEHETYEIETNNREIIVRSTATFADRTAELQFIFEYVGTLKSLTIDADYTKVEVMKTATMNTLLGMGTVFTVLIFIAFVISLFSYIPKIQTKFYNRRKKGQAVVTEPDLEEIETVVNDTELVAVIAAAVAVHTGQSTDEFIVRKIKRRKTNQWS